MKLRELYADVLSQEDQDIIVKSIIDWFHDNAFVEVSFNPKAPPMEQLNTKVVFPEGLEETAYNVVMSSMPIAYKSYFLEDINEWISSGKASNPMADSGVLFVRKLKDIQKKKIMETGISFGIHLIKIIYDENYPVVPTESRDALCATCFSNIKHSIL